MQITVLLFASLKDLAGAGKIELELDQPARMRDVKDRLAALFPALETRLVAAVAAVNQEFAFDQDEVPEGAEVAFFPPVSGGGNAVTILLVVEEAIDLDELVGLITTERTGAVCLFTGVVRGETQRGEPHQTSYLEYEAYQPMAKAKLAQVAGEIRQRWPVIEGIAIVQRIGRLQPGTPTVLIACSAGHRDTGVFEAARFGIDRLKEIVPIWKKEVGPRGESWVEGEYHPKAADRGSGAPEQS
jgi:molybdopterin synthase catalytic subunit